MQFNFDSYVLPLDNSPQRVLRSLTTDNRLVLPYGTGIRILVSSLDVLHAWTVPSLGVKADATPGRLNQINFTPNRAGVVFGQCSEICGANHRFMPIMVELIHIKDFIK